MTSSLHDKDGNWRGYNLNLVDLQEQYKKEFGLEVLEWTMDGPSMHVALKKDGQIGTSTEASFEDAVQAAVQNLGKGDQKFYDLIVAHDLLESRKTEKPKPPEGRMVTEGLAALHIERTRSRPLGRIAVWLLLIVALLFVMYLLKFNGT